MTYRSRYRASIELPLVLDLLLVDEINPRSLAFQLVGLEQRFRTLHRAPMEELRELLGRVRSTPLDELVHLEPAAEGAGWRAKLGALLADLAAGLPALADALSLAYLSHALPQRRGPGFRRGDA